MKLVIAPDSFKGSLTAAAAAEAIRRGVARVSARIRTACVPLADGGEGTVEALVAGAGGRIRKARATGPLGAPVDARYGVIDRGRTGIVEMAAASGLPLVPPSKRDPLRATTYGTGELIRRAVADGCRDVIIGAGGSATVDGGVGMLQALGVRFLDAKGKPVGRGGRELERIVAIETGAIEAALWGIGFTIAADVTSPLCGPRGAALVYGPQKGADPETARRLDGGLRHFASVAKKSTGKDATKLAGAGAAGGLAAGAWAFLGAGIRPGVDLVIERTKLEAKLVDCDLVITGEGRTDGQTAFGKAPLGAARLAKKHGVPAVCLSGSLDGELDSLYAEGFTALYGICPGPMTTEEAMARAGELLERAAENVVRLFVSGRL
ncbi:MAG: glycerate kinase [Spirochaetales bacterium]|nr:glycerate kinase [Spirochaetales bacterium]